jgi:hypothetical protein
LDSVVRARIDLQDVVPAWLETWKCEVEINGKDCH